MKTKRIAMAVASCLLAVAPLAPLHAAEPLPARERALRQLATEARIAHQGGDFAKAAELYGQAWLLEPGDGGFLYGNARALHEAGDLPQAITRYEAFLGMERQDPRLVERAQRFLGTARLQQRERAARKAALEATPAAPVEAPREVTASAAPAPARAEPAAAVIAVRVPDPPPVPGGRAPWYVAAAGGVTAVAASLFAVSAWQDRRTFDAAMSPGFAGQKVDAYPSREAATAQAGAIASRQTASAVTLGVGVAVALAGAVWAWSTGSPSDSPSDSPLDLSKDSRTDAKIR